MIEVQLIPHLDDNYAYLLMGDNGDLALIDPGHGQQIVAWLESRDIKPDMIINTHHHWDHTNGNQSVKDYADCPVYGPAADQSRVPSIENGLEHGDVIDFGEETIEIFETPGHTANHICLYCPTSQLVFTGDTLFSMGCGRLFEGSAEEMYASLQAIAALPDATRVYCGHEYTVANGEFAMMIEPANQDILNRVNEARNLRAQDKPTLPSTIELEKQTNVFMRADNARRFAEIRMMKDQA